MSNLDTKQQTLKDEAKNLALAYEPLHRYSYKKILPFSKEKSLERLKLFIELGSQLKELRDEIDFLLEKISNGKGFSNLENIKTRNIPKGSITTIRQQINEWCCEKLFHNICNVALQEFDHIGPNKRKMPSIKAAAWLAYFAWFDEDEEVWKPTENWEKYYFENYSTSKDVVTKNKKE